MPSAPLSPRTREHGIDAAELIRAGGLRVTDSRRAVVDALAARPHASADEIFRHIDERMPSSTLQSVYNALSDFTTAGITRRIEPAGLPGLFELRVGDNHHHLVCTDCGRVEDVDCIVGHAPCLTPSDPRGFRLESAEVTFWGLCADCQAGAEDLEEPVTIRTDGRKS